MTKYESYTNIYDKDQWEGGIWEYSFSVNHLPNNADLTFVELTDKVAEAYDKYVRLLSQWYHQLEQRVLEEEEAADGN